MCLRAFDLKTTTEVVMRNSFCDSAEELRLWHDEDMHEDYDLNGFFVDILEALSISP